MLHAILKCFAATAALAIAAASTSSAWACACCSHTAQRSVHMQKIDSRIAAALEQMKFRSSTGPNRRITLVLHGRGNSCTDASSFKHWTLLVHGGGAGRYTFYGELD